MSFPRYRIKSSAILLISTLILSAGAFADAPVNFSTDNPGALSGTTAGQTAAGPGKVSEVPDFTFAAISGIKGLDAGADSFEFIGDNLVANGHIYLRKEGLILYADKAVVNTTNKNIELSGNVKFYSLSKFRNQMEYWDLKKLVNNPNAKFKVVGTVMTPSGRQQLVVDVIMQTLTWSGDNTVGNLNTGVFKFGKFDATISNWSVEAGGAVRKSDGDIVANNATISPSENLADGHSVMSLGCGRLVMSPTSTDNPKDYSSLQTSSDYDLWGYNSVFYVGDIPLFWFPVFYKPAPNKLGKWEVTYGNSSDYGNYVQTTNSWQILDVPKLTISNHVDYYSRRGLGLGEDAAMDTDNSKTTLHFYGINDEDPYKNVPNTHSQSVPSYRYDIDLQNVTHLTDRLDFRGRYANLSDYYFLNDFPSTSPGSFNKFGTDPEPASYGSLDYQFDKFDSSITLKPKVNDFYNQVQQLPEFLFDVPRQELFNNLYYQSTTKMGYYEMNWAKMDNNQYPKFGYPSDYQSGRFDTLQFLYYPMQMGWLNITPRAGGRATAYTRTSENSVSDNDLWNMINVSQPQQVQPSGKVNNYDSQGGSKLRLIPELGLEMNTKISRSWSDVKSAFWDMDGMRHVIQPYNNLTWIGPPTVNRNNLYYFDDTDRIQQQAFWRWGVENRLQTRRGGWKSSQVYTWASMNNYVDVLFDPRENDASTGMKYGGNKHIGDIGNKITLSPSESFSTDMQALIDGAQLSASSWNEAMAQYSITPKWKLADGWDIFGSYFYSNADSSSSEYSMGSSLDQLVAGSFFERAFNNSSYLQGGLNFKINERTRGTVNVTQDYQNHLIPSMGVTLFRDLPCGLQLILGASQSQQQNGDGNGGNETKTSYTASIGFSPGQSYAVSPLETMLPQEFLEVPPRG